MSHRGKNASSGTDQIWNGSRWVPGGSNRARGLQDFPIAVANGDDVFWSGTPAGFGDLYCIGTVPVEDTEFSQMACWVSQAPGGGGGVAMGLYDSSGARLAYTDIVAPSVGPNTLPLIFPVTPPVVLTGGNLYYLAVYCNQNGARLLRFSPGAAPPGTAIAFSVPNSGAINATGFPANVAGFFGNLTTQRWWIAGGT